MSLAQEVPLLKDALAIWNFHYGDAWIESVNSGTIRHMTVEDGEQRYRIVFGKLDGCGLRTM